MRFILGYLFFMGTISAFAQSVPRSEQGIFSGRVSKINNRAELIRIKVDFVNSKYLNKGDQVEIWSEQNTKTHCKASIVGKSNDYILLKILNLNFCRRFFLIAPGSYLKLFGQDLVNNLKTGRELVKILLKKRLALKGKLSRSQRELNKHIEKIDGANKRYETLRAQLEREWRDELAALEEDKLTILRDYKQLELDVVDIENKLEKYRIEDTNLKLDRWALDSRLYYKK